MICRNFGRIAVSLGLLFAIVGLTGAVLGAQPRERQPAVRPSVWEVPPQPQPPPPAQQNEFVPLKDLPPLQQERIPAAPLVMGAYAFVWVALLLYVWSVWRRVGAVQRELADLRRRTERKAQ